MIEGFGIKVCVSIILYTVIINPVLLQKTAAIMMEPAEEGVGWSKNGTVTQEESVDQKILLICDK